jgi:hypothetical protein
VALPGQQDAEEELLGSDSSEDEPLPELGGETTSAGGTARPRAEQRSRHGDTVESFLSDVDAAELGALGRPHVHAEWQRQQFFSMFRDQPARRAEEKPTFALPAGLPAGEMPTGQSLPAPGAVRRGDSAAGWPTDEETAGGGKPVGAAANKRWLAGQMGADWIGDRAGKNWQRGVDGLGGRRSEHLARVISRTKAQDGEGDGSNDRWQALMATAVCRAIPTPSARFSQVLREI